MLGQPLFELPLPREVLEPRILSKVGREADDNCWLWTGAVSHSRERGYPKLRIGQKVYSVRPIVFTLYVGAVPKQQNVGSTCGNVLCVNPDHLKLPATRPAARQMMAGERFGDLVVIEEIAPFSSGHRRIRCRCECGKERLVALHNLRPGGVRHCGRCRTRPPRKDPREKIVDGVFKDYRYRAMKQELEFSLTREDVTALIFSPCAYCEAAPANVKYAQQDTEIPYSGIDRIDSGGGYVIGNVAPACIVCNRAKSNMSVEAFKAWLLRAASHIQGRG
jgi:hypothetical protein